MSFLFVFFALLFAVFPFSMATGNSETSISGNVKHAENKEPLQFANVALLEPGDSTLVEGDATNEEGYFELTALEGRYVFRVTFMGFLTYWEDVTLSGSQVNMETIRLREAGAEMDEFTVEAPAAMFETRMDKRVFDVTQDIASRGGTAIDLLETLPSIQVDEEGGINMRGSGEIQVQINGRPTNLTSDDAESILEQFPADAIENVELITNPSARYQAEGVGGIINLELQEETGDGLTLSLNNSITAGLSSNPSDPDEVPGGPLPTYNSGINLDNRTGRWTFSASYSYRYRRPWEYSETFRENKVASGSPILDHDYSTMNYRESHLIQTGIDFQLNDDHTIGLLANANIRPRDRERQYSIRHKNSQDQLDSLFSRNLEEDRIGRNYETGLSYTWNIEEDHLLYSELTYSLEDQDRIEYFDEKFLN